MHPCTCPPRQTLAERINAIIAKYKTCPCPSASEQQTRKSCVPKIFSSPCLHGPSCSPPSCSPCPHCILCPALASSSCSPESQPSPGPGLLRYISRRNLCPALKSCLSLYKRPSVTRSPVVSKPSCYKSTCSPSPMCTSSIICPKSKQNCAVVGKKSRPMVSTRSKKPTVSTSSCNYCTKCIPFAKCPEMKNSPCPRSIPTSCCPGSENSCVTCGGIVSPRCYPSGCTPCSACCYSHNSESTGSRCTNPCCYSCATSSDFSSISTPGSTWCNSGSSRPARRRLTVFDDPPYTSNSLEREFSSRFVRLDSCNCETDSSSSLDNPNFGNKYR